MKVQSVPSLSPREKQILIGAGLGYQVKEIAARLKISEHTARHHRENTHRKLRVKNPAQALVVALTNEQLSLRDFVGTIVLH